MQDIRTFGRVPKAVRGNDPEQVAERNLASRLRKVKQAGRLTPEREAELASFREMGPCGEADAAPDPLDPFAEEADSRLEQDLLTVHSLLRLVLLNLAGLSVLLSLAPMHYAIRTVS